MVRPGEKTADEYRADAARVRQEAKSVRQQLLNTQLRAIAMNYDELARIATMLERARNEQAASGAGWFVAPIGELVRRQ